jgi:hypothetical protein
VLYRRPQSESEQAQCLLHTGLETMANLPSGPALYGGLGVTWALEHLLHMSADGMAHDDPNACTDEALVAVLEQAPWPADFDLISGRVGIGI